jgi:hypothetical protein
MAVLRFVDGSILAVVAVACRDRAGMPQEITPGLTRDLEPFEAGERLRLSALSAGCQRQGGWRLTRRAVVEASGAGATAGASGASRADVAKNAAGRADAGRTGHILGYGS